MRKTGGRLRRRLDRYSVCVVGVGRPICGGSIGASRTAERFGGVHRMGGARGAIRRLYGERLNTLPTAEQTGTPRSASQTLSTARSLNFLGLSSRVHEPWKVNAAFRPPFCRFRRERPPLPNR